MLKKYLLKIVLVSVFILTLGFSVCPVFALDTSYINPLLNQSQQSIDNSFNAQFPKLNQPTNTGINAVGPTIANAACLATPSDFKSFVECKIIRSILNPLVPFLVALAVVAFIYGVVMFTFSDGGDKKEEAKKFMFWGIIGLFIMISIWGIVAIFQDTFGLGGYNSGVLPKINI